MLVVMRRRIWLWAFYDFANSLAFVSVMFYFSLWFVSEKGVSDTWISIAVAFSTVLMLFTLPFLGHLSDRLRRRMPFLTVFTILCALSLFGIGVLARGMSTLSSLAAIGVICLYFAFQYFYQSSLAFYNAFLRELVANPVGDDDFVAGRAHGVEGDQAREHVARAGREFGEVGR
jgi:MFS-type transporter involved in bile tolerance (Atg22 family)